MKCVALIIVVVFIPGTQFFCYFWPFCARWYVTVTHVGVDGSNTSADASPIFVEVVVPWLFGLICVVGLVGNALVVLVVACNPQMRSTTNMLIINLAIADLLFIVFCVPFTAIDYSVGKLDVIASLNSPYCTDTLVMF
ncbi:allatostatin-A receptor-like [Tropilaelaps mercedesae]|uniref:Allatostatin-A receptor-like n=1 Tax=Tropilaelaps mercedesae TaxID=418985 RepID=A0A1V9XK48_9ACAR|nr:allatostatin-A receptor-like [Tropilaelaps mercedesae]